MASQVSPSSSRSNQEDQGDSASVAATPVLVEARRLLKRKAELELLQRRFGGIRILEERELRAIEARLAAGVNAKPVDTVTPPT